MNWIPCLRACVVLVAGLIIMTSRVVFAAAAADRPAEPAAALPPAPAASRDFIRRADGSTFKFATQRVVKAARYPRRMVEIGGEGWVLVRFIVQRDGTVRDPVVVDSSRLEFERPALDAVSQFIYEPATLDGEPVEQAMTMYRIVFTLEPPQSGARSEFVRAFKLVDRQIRRGELDKAADRLAIMESVGRLNLYEDAYFWWAQASYYGATGEHHQRRESLLRAIAYAGDDRPGSLPQAVHLQGLEFLYGDYVRTGELAGALDIYEQIVARAGPGKDSPTIRAHAESLRTLLESDATIQAEGYIHGDRPWPHTLSRDGFEFAEIAGELQRFSLWCDQRAVELTIDPGSSWQVPESWGKCQIYVRGRAGTSFALVEYSSKAAP